MTGSDRPTSDVAPLLQGARIAKRFGGVTALAGVDIEVRPGEIVGLVGPNGSGKSTLLDCLSGRLQPDSGRVRFRDIDSTALPNYSMARSGMTRTFQTARLFDELTVWENALLARQWGEVGLRGLVSMPDASVRDRARDLLDIAGIDGKRSELAGYLSGGQKRLLELVMAFMPRPHLVLMDEATAGVNPILLETLTAYLEQLHRTEGTAYLLVEHNMRFIFSIAERIVVLTDGRELAAGTPEQIRNNDDVIDAYLGA